MRRTQNVRPAVILASLVVLMLAYGSLVTLAQAGESCCTIVGVDKRTTVVTARERATGRTLRFRVKHAALLKRLKAGQTIGLRPDLRRLNAGQSFSVTFGPRAGSLRPHYGEDCCTLVSRSAPRLDPGLKKPGMSPRARTGTRAQPVTLTLDPCVFASEDQVRGLFDSRLNQYFPMKPKLESGRSLTLSDPRLSDVRCPNLNIAVRNKLKYRKTRGVPQYSTSGSLRFGSPVAAQVTYNPGSGGAPQPSDIQQARACMTDIRILGLDLKRVPNWLDSTWIRKCLNGQFPGCKRLAHQLCVDVTGPVKSHLARGGRLSQ